MVLVMKTNKQVSLRMQGLKGKELKDMPLKRVPMCMQGSKQSTVKA